MKDFSVNSSIVISTKHSTRTFRTPLLMILALCGSISMLDVCITMINPEFNKSLFWCISVLAVLVTLFLSILPKHLHLTGYLPLIAGIGYTMLNSHKAEIGAKLFCNAYYSAAYKTDTKFFELIPVTDEKAFTTLFMCCVSVILCSLISRLVIRKPLFLFYFMLTFIPVEFGLYHGLEMRLFSMMILIITWFGVLGVQLSTQKGHTSSSRGVRTSNTANCGIAAAAVTAIAAVISFTVCGSLGLTSKEDVQDKRREVRKEIEDFDWNDVVGSLTDLGVSIGFLNDPDERELGTKNSLEYKNEDEVRITLNDLPEQGFYLKNYTGSVYEDNTWRTFSDDEWEENQRLSTLFTRFECVPQILPFMNNQSLYSLSENTKITIEPIKRSSAILQPYASYTDSGSYKYDYGCSVKNKKKYSFSLSLIQDFSNISDMHINEYYLPSSGFNFSDSITASFFKQLDLNEEQDMFTISALVPPYLDNSEYTTQSLQAILAENYVYRDFVHDSYTNIEDDDSMGEVFASLPAELISTGNNGSSSEILNAIRSYLAEQCEYTLSPGRTPSTREFVNYFLLENNAGYCMHYATAGTVIARHFGIPARYCEGYIISADMMQNGTENKDGSVTIDIPDSASHAWCEYYADGYGWIPFEFTPGYYDNAPPEEPAYTETSITSETSVTQTTAETETVKETTVSASSVSTTAADDESHVSDDRSSANAVSFDKAFKAVFKIFISLMITAAIAGMVVILRRISIDKRNKRFFSYDRKYVVISIYKHLCRLLRIEKIESENMQMLDFAENVKTSLDSRDLDGNIAKEIILSALAADMGGKEPSEENLKVYAEYVSALGENIIKSKPWYNKIIMKYVLHLI